jgi:MiaB/RimO family radical SAM methylthiotransferase
MKVFIDCLACEQRKLDAQRVIDYLKANKIKLTDSPKGADKIIMITCAVDTANETANLNRIIELKNQARSSKLIIGGCLPFINQEAIRKFDIEAIFSPRNLESLDQIFHPQYFKMADIPYPTYSKFDNKLSSGNKNLSPREEYDLAKNGYRIKIDEGCLGDCTYCVIKRATGSLISVPPDEIVKQFKKAVKRKGKTITLMGGDTGAYGMDINYRFYKLLSDLISVNGSFKVYIHDFNVRWIIQDLDKYMEMFAKNEKLCKIKIANIPIQSGSNKILSAMKRHHTSEEAITAIQSVRKINPSMILGTHVIIGFPGEEDRDFDDTMDMLHTLNFDFFSCFEYSENYLAASAKLINKVDKQTIDQRMKKMQNQFRNKVKIYRI